MNMSMIMSLACAQMKMSPAEAITATTINAAYSLRRASRIGSFEVGKFADLAVFDVADYREIPYYFGVNLCVLTMKRGKIIYSRGFVISLLSRARPEKTLPGRGGFSAMRKIIECVPNFSEGRDVSKIEAIISTMREVPGVSNSGSRIGRRSQSLAL